MRGRIGLEEKGGINGLEESGSDGWDGTAASSKFELVPIGWERTAVSLEGGFFSI